MDLFVDLLEERDLLLQGLDASLQVQTGQSGGVHILQQFGWLFKRKSVNILLIRAEKNELTHRPESCQVVLRVLFLEDFFLEPGRGETETPSGFCG